MQQTNNYQFKPRKNYQIKASQVRLIDHEGNNVGVVSFQDAILQAKGLNLDLIEINSKSIPIVVKIGDYGKMLYEEKKKAQIAKKNQQAQELKEITLKPNIDINDLTHKMEHAKEFLTDGNKVKITIKFVGRMITHPEVGRDKLNWLIQQLDGLIIANPQINLEGKFMSTTLSPIKR